jgi:hypothetical protein
MKLEKTKMFKKTLIAASLAATAFGASASTVTLSATETLGVEWAVATAQMATTADVTVTPARDYDSGDIITISYTGANVATMTAAATPVAIVPTVTGAGNLLGNVEFLEFAGNTVKLLVTNPVSAAAGTFVTVSGVQLDVSGAADKGKINVSAVGTVATVEGAKTVDASTAVTYATYATEYKTAVTDKFDGTIDVNAARKAFSTAAGENGSDSASADTLVLTNTVGTVTQGSTSTGAVYTVKGDFTFLDENGDGDLLDAKDGSIASAAGTVKVADDMMSATITSTAAVTSGTVGVTVNTPAGVTIPDQEFTASSALSYTVTGVTGTLTSNTLTDAAAGSWTLNGANVHVPVLYFGSAFAQSVIVTNTSSQAGGVDIVVYQGGDTYEMNGVGNIVSEGTTDITAWVQSAVAGAGITSGAVAFDVIVNAPSANITVSALYYAKADGDRVKVN